MAEPLRGERAVVLNYLAHFRSTFEALCEGLDDDQLATRSVPPSSMSLLGLLRHLAAVEYSWFRRVMERRLDRPKMWGKDEHRDADFDGAVADPDVVAEAWAAWRAEVEFAEQWVDAAPSFDVTGELDTPDGRIDIELRDVLVHLVEEYARHCGHADLLRERIDGRTGIGS
ncbi:DinB family protein [Nocardioides sp. GXZ039]|uniref:DinB family protein n=1 Tax=Nocardioides sp. GXZ039 TaxID=3136018 RepID=UPI0030F48F3B